MFEYDEKTSEDRMGRFKKAGEWIYIILAMLAGAYFIGHAINYLTNLI